MAAITEAVLLVVVAARLVWVVAAQCVLFTPATRAYSHRQTQETCDGTLYSNC
jgi:hypothetical protein